VGKDTQDSGETTNGKVKELCTWIAKSLRKDCGRVTSLSREKSKPSTMKEDGKMVVLMVKVSIAS
jgi:hypothetical protein